MKTRLTVLITLILSLSGPTTIEVMACDEMIGIDSVEYPVTEFWCGKRLDSTSIAEPEQLVQLPQEMTYEDYRIFILPATRQAFLAMAEAALEDSVELIVDSGFRSLAFQRRIILSRLAAGDSFEEVLNSVAPPGYSEHHTGRSLDLCPSEAKFAFTSTYGWMKDHAAEYGFVETLPEDPSAPLTWESWHWTYQGDPDSTSVK